MEYRVNKLKEEYEVWGLSMNLSKTEYLCIGGEVVDLNKEVERITGCQTFNYLGSVIQQDGTCIRDIETKIVHGKLATKALHGVIWIKSLSKENKKGIFLNLVVFVYVYDIKIFTISFLHYISLVI